MIESDAHDESMEPGQEGMESTPREMPEQAEPAATESSMGDDASGASDEVATSELVGEASDAAPEHDASEVDAAAPADDERGIPGAPTTTPPPAPESSEPKGEWFAVRVQSNKEDSVRRNMSRRIEMKGLQRKISEILVPTEKVAEIKNGKKRTRSVKTYPGYVLVRMIMDDETWAFVRETGGVGDFVGGGATSDQKPFPLRQEEVNKILGIETPGAEPERVEIDFGTGDKVKIREGPFENFDGVVEEIDEIKGKVKVVVTIFGRATPVELQYWQVEVI